MRRDTLWLLAATVSEQQADRSLAAVHESASGTKLPRANATACPQLAKADVGALTRGSGYVLCAGFRTPATTSYRHAAEAGVRKAPRHEIAGSRPRSAVPQAQLWGFERRTCRVRASARREVERLRREKQAGGFALSAARPEKRGSSGYLLGERRICAS